MICIYTCSAGYWPRCGASRIRRLSGCCARSSTATARDSGPYVYAGKNDRLEDLWQCHAVFSFHASAPLSDAGILNCPPGITNPPLSSPRHDCPFVVLFSASLMATSTLYTGVSSPSTVLQSTYIGDDAS
ncbi:hypothetical protein A0H81_02362 [Grifola frondosa]|uniref:Uncharacterized protein n=1 Tax=Grifola frondosa TaxID=5627 RepID=A0A1C7MT86_GRIFR|nr:hypothetical protein A0H81_02362 [Grifola frondosa]